MQKRIKKYEDVGLTTKRIRELSRGPHQEGSSGKGRKQI